VETAAGTGNQPQDTPFNDYRNAWWDAVRARWPPTVNMDAMAGLCRNPGEETHSYLRRAAVLWHDAFGVRHEKTTATTHLWRAAVLAGLDKEVQDQLALVVGLNRMSATQWTEHVIHYIKREDKIKDSSKDEQAKLTNRLLKIQISKEEDEVNKNKTKKAKQMVQTEVPPEDTDQQQVQHQVQPRPQYAPQYPPQQYYGQQGYGYPPAPWYPQQQMGYQRGRPLQRGRGRGMNMFAYGVCRTCNQYGHWARECPNSMQPQRPPGPPQAQHSGRGQARPPGPPQPAQTPAPHGQFPVGNGPTPEYYFSLLEK